MLMLLLLVLLPPTVPEAIQMLLLLVLLPTVPNAIIQSQALAMGQAAGQMHRACTR